MILSLIAAAAIAAQPTPSTPVDPHILSDAARAIQGGRLEEAKLIIGRAIAAGFTGPPIERLTADLAFASGRFAQALPAYQQLAGSSARQPGDCERGALSALKIGRVDAARPLVACAIASPRASWRAWNARGVVSDFTQDWQAADESYTRAHELAPNQAQIINNQGWSKLLRGDWAAAIPLLEQAASLDRKTGRIANNLELAKAALAADLPRRQPGESDRDWAVRLNDAGVIAELRGEKMRAVAAFTQALDASPVWYDRASNNLQALSQN